MKLMSWNPMQQKVFVYRNLQQKCWSVKSRTGANYGRVILHVRNITLSGAHFSVNAKGRARVLEERQKNVHAGVVGYLGVAEVIQARYPDVQAATVFETELQPGTHPLDAIEVTYNPYKFEEFVDVATETPVRERFLTVTLDHDMRVWSIDNSVEAEVA